MTGAPARRPATAAGLGSALLALVLAGCSGGQDRPTAADSTAAIPVTTAATSTAPAGAAAGSAPAPGPSRSGTTTPATATPDRGSSRSTARPTAPNTSQLRPHANRAQRRFVTRNAPPGIDAEAILQSGEDACQRMTLTQHASGRTAVAVALASGQIANGPEAITYLCPQLTPTLDAARDGFPDGSYQVGTHRTGTQLRPGRYTAPQASDQCTWSLTRLDGSRVADHTQHTGATPTTTLRTGQRFTSTGCYAWLRRP
jgi:hypothetical protein